MAADEYSVINLSMKYLASAKFSGKISINMFSKTVVES